MVLDRILSFLKNIGHEGRRISALEKNLKEYVLSSLDRAQTVYHGGPGDYGFKDAFYSSLMERLNANPLYAGTNERDLSMLFRTIDEVGLDSFTRCAIEPVIRTSLINASKQSDFEFEEEAPSSFGLNDVGLVEIYPADLKKKAERKLDEDFEWRLLKDGKNVRVVYSVFPKPYTSNMIDGIRVHASKNM